MFLFRSLTLKELWLWTLDTMKLIWMSMAGLRIGSVDYQKHVPALLSIQFMSTMMESST